MANAGSCRPMTAVNPGNAKSEEEKDEAVKMIEPKTRNGRKARATFDPASNPVALTMHHSSSYVDTLWKQKDWLNWEVPFWVPMQTVSRSNPKAGDGTSMFVKQQTNDMIFLHISICHPLRSLFSFCLFFGCLPAPPFPSPVCLATVFPEPLRKSTLWLFLLRAC